jgi:hypothetical protein
MTPIALVLEQRSTLLLHAFEQTRDLNEAYFLVHGVITQALGRVGGPEQDLGSVMKRALDARARQTAGLEVLG